jgi:ankyrin repeat protein
VLAKSIRGGRLLEHALCKRHRPSVKALLDAGADPNTRNEQGVPLLLVAVKGNVDLVNMLLTHGADVNARDPRLQTALHIAALGRDLECLRILIDHGANINAQTRSGETPLVCAVLQEFPDGVQLLLERGADAGLPTCGKTALQVAEGRHQDAIASLLRAHARQAR